MFKNFETEKKIARKVIQEEIIRINKGESHYSKESFPEILEKAELKKYITSYEKKELLNMI